MVNFLSAGMIFLEQLVERDGTPTISMCRVTCRSGRFSAARTGHWVHSGARCAVVPGEVGLGSGCGRVSL